jgi:hypothetical protein
MKSIVPHPTPTPQHAVDRTRDPNRQPHEPRRKRALVVGLDEQVHVVGLHGEVHDTKPRSRSSPKGPTNCVKQALSAQARHPARRAQSDMHRIRFLVLGPNTVRNCSAVARTLSPRTTALSAAFPKHELLLSPSSHVKVDALTRSIIASSNDALGASVSPPSSVPHVTRERSARPVVGSCSRPGR